MKNELHDETAEWNDSSSCRSTRGLPQVVVDVSTYINGGSGNEITQKYSSPKIDECGVGQWVEVGEHDQLQCGQLRGKLCSANGGSCTGYLMIVS